MLKTKSVSYLTAVAALLMLWQIISMILNLAFLPAPLDVFTNLFSIFLTKIYIHALSSLMRVFLGIAISMLIGVPVGLFMGYFSKLDRLLSPVVYFTYPIPKIALLPLVMLFFGLGELSKVLMITMIVVFQMIVAARDSVKNIPKETFYSLTSLGASKTDVFRRAIVPASFPGLLTSLRISMGTALSVLFFTETFGTQYGMGYFIMDSWMRVNYIDMFSGILVLSVIGILLFSVIDLLERICKWKKANN